MQRIMGTKRRAAAASYIGIFKKRPAAQYKEPVLLPGGLSCPASTEDVLCRLLCQVRDDGRKGRVEDGEASESGRSAGILCEERAELAARAEPRKIEHWLQR